MKKLIFLFVLTILFSGMAVAQKEFNNWFFGNKAGLNFNSGTPAVLPGGNVVSDASSSSISDAQGNLLFYSDGVTVWDRNHQPMPNGTGLQGDVGGSQTVLITYYPGSNSLYYIFTVGKGGQNYFRYSIVDMKLNNGLGNIVAGKKNESFNVPATEKITAVKHQNGIDLWLIFHLYNTNAFFVYYLDCSGAFVPVVSNIGSVITTPDNARGYLKASPDGKKLVSANFAGNFEVFDFDNLTGKITNFQTLPVISGNACGPYGVEFSPDSKLLYVSETYTCAFPFPLYTVLQYKVDPDINTMIASRVVLDAGNTNLAGALQLGPDNKIYIAYSGASFLGVISNPNVYGIGSTFSKQNLLQAPATSTLGLPNILAGFKINTLAEDTTLCDGAPLTLKVDFKNATYTWNTGSMLDSIVVTQSGQYSVIIQSNNVNASCTIKDTINVIFAPAPKFKLPNDTLVCRDKLPLLLAPTLPAGTYLWQDSTTNPTYTVNAQGLYWLQVTSNTCTYRDSVLIMAPPGTAFNLGADTTICSNDSLKLTANVTANSYLWNTGSTANTINIKTSGTYWCEAKYANGCSYRDSINITVNPSPVFNLGKDTMLCQNKFPLLLNQPIPGAAYLWQDSSTLSSFTVPGAGLYWLRVTLNGCSARDSIDVKSTPAPSFTLGADTAICTTVPYVRTVNPAFTSYLWSTGSTLKSISITTTGDYWCEVTNGSGCSFRDSIKISVNAPPTVNLGKDTSLCPGQFPFVLSQTIAGATYLWQDGSTASSFSASANGTYWLQAALNGCSARDSIVITSSPLASFNLGADTAICTTVPYVLTVNPVFSSYLWSNGSTTKSINVTSTGLYWCEVTNGAGCKSRDSINISVNTPPVVNLGKDTTLCSTKFPYLLSQPIPGASYLWQDGSTGSSLSASTAGVYWLQATVNGCASRDSIIINSNPAPSFTLGADTSVCSSNPYVLTVNPAFSTYLWNTGSTSKSISITASGVYWCEVSNGSGCSFRDSIQVTINIPPVVNLGADTTLCSSQFPFVLSKSVAGASYLWQDGSTGNSINIASAGIYWLQATINGCSSRDSIIVKSVTAASFNLGNDTIVCSAGPYTLTVNPGFSNYLWSTGSTTRSIAITSSGLYWCEASNGTGCSFRDSIFITINTPPVVNLGKDTALCPNQYPYPLSQSPVSGATYLWQDGSTANTFSVTNPGTYWLQVTAGNCSSRDSIVVSSSAVTSFSLGADTIVCSASPLVLTVNPAFTTYLWSTGSTSRNINVTVSGTYWCEVSNGNGCRARDSILVTITAPPVVNLGSDTSLCSNQFPYTINQSPISGATYLWQDGSTGNSFVASSAGTYWLAVSLNGCTSRDSVIIKSSPVTTFSLGADTVVCSSTPFVITVNPSFNAYLWNTGSTSRSLSITVDGLYWCEVSNGTGCSARDSIQVTLKAAPVVDLGRDTSLCSNQFPYTIRQSPIAGATYLWQDGSTGNTLTATSAGTYWLDVFLNGCSVRDSIILKSSAVATFSLGADTAICAANGYTLNASAGFSTYLWNTGSTAASITITASGLYWCDVSNGVGCSARDSITIIIKAAPLVNLGSDTTVCQNQFPVLLGQSIPGATYLWQDGSTGSSLSAATAGSYWLQASMNGCSSRDSILVRSNPVTSFNLGSDTTLCAGNPLVLTVNPAFTSYLWNTGSTLKSINVTANGTYWCEARNSSGCAYRDSIVVTFKPSPVVNLGNDTTVCSNGFPFVIGQVVPGASYLWQDGTTNATYSVTRAGTYSVEVSANGCTTKDNIIVTSVTQSTFTLGPDLAICSSSPLALTANVTASNYLWSTGSRSQSITVNTSGDYWCEINSGTGCSFRDTIRVTFSAPIVFSLGNDTVICDNRPLLLDMSNKGDTYTWQDNSRQPQFLVSRSGTYSVTIAKGSCVKSDTVVITYSKPQIPNLGADKTICPGEEILLDANVLSGSYLWQDGSTARTFKVTSPGTYSVQVQNDCGKNTDEIIIGIGSCKLMIPNAFTPGKLPNSTFRVLNARDVTDFNLQLFGRWGQKVFQTAKPTEGWDGKYNGLEQPAGTYVFQVSYTDTITGKKISQKGAFLLVR